MAQQDDIIKWGVVGVGLYLAYNLFLKDGGMLSSVAAKLLPGSGDGASHPGGESPAQTYTAPGLRVSLSNTSRPGQPFRVGDSFVIEIENAKPGAQFAVSATQNDKSLGTTPFGKVDAQGKYRQTGTLDASTVGHWNEKWLLDGIVIYEPSFDVAAASTSITGLSAGSDADLYLRGLGSLPTEEAWRENTFSAGFVPNPWVT